MRSTVTFLALALISASPTAAQRLTINFLPPDLPPSDICNAEAELFDEDETQIAEDGPGAEVLDDTVRLQLLARDIRNLQRTDAEGGFAFIMALISRRAELDAKYAGVPETFDRIDTYLLAGRRDELVDSGLIETLTNNIEELGWSETIRLARYYLNGHGATKDREFAVGLIVETAYLGSAAALMEVLRMQMRGEDVGDWILPMEETARLAFGGLVGQPNRSMCARVERMARAYLDGDILSPNPELAFAWRKFAADQGGGEAAWRVVEHYLNATGTGQNEAELRHYLQQAVANGFVIMPENVDEIVESGATTEAEVRRILGTNHARSGSDRRLSAERFMDLEVRLVSDGVGADSEILQYLREISALPDPHPSVLTRLAREVLLRNGRWEGRDEAITILRRASAGGDTDAMMLMAELLLAERRETTAVTEAETVLTEAVTRYGHAPAMAALDTLYRCQLPTAPHLSEAAHWAQAYRSANVAPVTISPNDLSALDGRSEPENVARLHKLALGDHATSTASWLQYLQSDIFTPETTLRHWAERTARSKIALKTYALQQYDLANTPLERKSAAEFVRRVYLDIGSAIALDLTLALIRDSARDPSVVEQILKLLDGAAQRGEGAAIRLMQRLTGRDSANVYADYAEAIELRGDFLAMMISAPHVDDTTFALNMDRAISMMNCTTKDVLELAEAYLARGDSDEALRWMRVGMSLEGGNSMSQLGLSDTQIDAFGAGLSTAQDMLPGLESEGDAHELARRMFLESADPNSERFDPDVAATALHQLIASGTRERINWAVGQYRKADSKIRRAIDAVTDLRAVVEQAASAGDVVAQYHLGLLIRDNSASPTDLATSTEWLRQAAEAGHGPAMIDYAFAVGFGIGRPADPKWALTWLERAEHSAPAEARELHRLFSALVAQ